jgi:5-methylthioadenosine/S-adenosylhomocysteine deaminase
LPHLLNNGIIIALGTDSLASNDTLSILEEMRQAKALFPGITNQTLLEMATINGARVLGLVEQIGSITPGKEANLIAFELETDTFDPISYIVEKADKPTFVMIGGSILPAQK